MNPHDALDEYEAEILAAYEKDEIKPNNASKADLAKYRAAASATFLKDKRVNSPLFARLDGHSSPRIKRRDALSNLDCQRAAQIRYGTFH